MPLILVKITAPLLLARTRRPLTFFARSYAPRLVLCVLIAIFVFYSAQLRTHPVAFYSLLLVLLGFNEALVYTQAAARGGFFACISDKRIGSTYYTFLASLNNLGMFLSSTVVLHTASWLPDDHGYFIEVAVCVMIGFVWLGLCWRLMGRLQTLPLERWHLMLQEQKVDDDDDVCQQRDRLTIDGSHRA